MSKLTTFLYAKPSFIEGVARLFDFSGSLNIYNCSDSPQQADSKAIASDWITVGCDIKRAVRSCQEQDKIMLNDGLVKEAKNQLMKDQTMQKLVILQGK
jgi:hypothetical protein